MSLNKPKKGLSRNQEREVQRLLQTDLKRVLFFILTIFQLAIPASSRFTDVTELCGNHNIKPEFTSKGFKLKWIVCLSAGLLFFCYQVVIKAMFTQYIIAFGPPQRAIHIRPLFEHKNGCAAPISKVEHSS